jgi:hypothetical protein
MRRRSLPKNRRSSTVGSTVLFDVTTPRPDWEQTSIRLERFG